MTSYSALHIMGPPETLLWGEKKIEWVKYTFEQIHFIIFETGWDKQLKYFINDNYIGVAPSFSLFLSNNSDKRDSTRI